MGRSALILVDIQNDFVPGGALAVPEGDQVVAVANRLQAHVDLVVATQDWHPADHASFASNHEGKQVYDRIEWAGLEQVLWPDHCVQGTPGAEFVAGLETARVAEVFRKGTDRDIDSYSGFFDNGHRRSTGLGAYLREQGVTRVYLVGLATDYCVKFTALDARRLELETFVVEDGCRAVEVAPGDGARALEEMRAAGVKVIRSEELRGRTIAEGRWLRFMEADGWEYVERVRASAVAVIVAVTPGGALVLVEQVRRSMGCPVVELPAGLVGDLAGSEDEAFEVGAGRELEEETGWRAARLTRLFEGPSSAGISNETVTLVRAEGLEKVGDGGGDEHEEILVHEVPLAEVPAFLEEKLAGGALVDPKVYAGLWYASRP